MKEKRRIYLLDDLRGIAVIGMVIYHLVYSLAYIFHKAPAVDMMYCLDFLTSFAGIFIFICGICTRFTKSNYKRGAKLFLLSLIISIVTLFVPDNAIYFGILHLLSLSILFFQLTRRILDKIPPAIGIVIFTLLFIVTAPVSVGYLNLIVATIKLPMTFYSTPFLFPFGFPEGSFVSADYFPLLPNLFLFLAGSYAGVYFKRGNYPAVLNKPLLKPVEFIGRHSLVIYVLHQPVILTVLFILFKIF